MANKKEKISHPVTKQKSGLAIASLVLGIVSFIPSIGFITGIIAIVFGVVSLNTIKREQLKGKKLAIWGIVLGVIGILFTVILYGSLFFMMFFMNSGPFAEVKVKGTQQILTQNAGALELYKKKHGRYPAKVTDTAKDDILMFPFDHFNHDLLYKVSSDGQTYEMRSVGPDGEFNTKDDIIIP